MPHKLLKDETPSGFQELLGYRLAEWRDGYAVLELAIEPKHGNRAGLVHGGVLTTLIDTACGFAATWTDEPGKVRKVMTLTLATSFTGQARHGVIRAVGRRKAGGKRVVFCAAEVFDAEGNLVAMGEGSFRYRSGSEPA